MANINDSAGIFTGATLHAFNGMQTAVARDGDLAVAQELMRRACVEIVLLKGTFTGTGTTNIQQEKRQQI